MAKAKISKETEAATALLNGLSVEDAAKMVTEVSAAYHRMLDETREKQLAEAKEKLASNKDAATVRTLVNETDAAIDEFVDHTFKVTYNVPITFEFSWNCYSTAADLVDDNRYNGPVDLHSLFETSKYRITLGKCDMPNVARKAVQSVVDDALGDICCESLLLFPEQLDKAKNIVKNINKAIELCEKVRKEGHDFTANIAVADAEE